MKITIRRLRQIIREAISSLDHPTKPPEPLKCSDCGRILTSQDKQAYEAEGGEGYPEVCTDCAESPDIKESKLDESVSRITKQEMAAWARGDWGFVSEGVMEEKYMSAEEAEEFISQKDGDEIAKFDIIDDETGEIYVQAGEDFRTSKFNVDHKPDKKKALGDKEYAMKFGLPYVCDKCDDEVYPEEYNDHDLRCGKSDYEDDDDDVAIGDADESDKLLIAAEEFAENWRGMSGELDAQGVSAEDAAQDAYVNFFSDYPEWKKWALAAGMTKGDVMSLVQDLVYSAING